MFKGGEEWLNLPLKTVVSVPTLLVGIVGLETQKKGVDANAVGDTNAQTCLLFISGSIPPFSGAKYGRRVYGPCDNNIFSESTYKKETQLVITLSLTASYYGINSITISRKNQENLSKTLKKSIKRAAPTIKQWLYLKILRNGSQLFPEP